MFYSRKIRNNNNNNNNKKKKNNKNNNENIIETCPGIHNADSFHI